MHKLLVVLGIFLLLNINVYAAKIPNEVRDYIVKDFPNADIRFDGVIILPSNTIYLPIFPSLFSDIKTLSIKETFPANQNLKQEPDIVIFNNDFALMKVLSDKEGHRTVLHQTNPPLQIRTGLLPQDMLVPSGLIIPENIKAIIGNLKIDTKSEDVIRVENKDAYEDFLKESEPAIPQTLISELKNKTVFVTTNISKNIQVVEPAKSVPDYSLAQQSIPIDVKAVNNGKFLLVTSYDRPYIDIVSVADSRFIKQLRLDSNPEQILTDEDNDKVYVASPSASTIFVLDLKSMSLIQKIKINGYCEHMHLSDNKLFYVDKLNNEIWAIELQNDYEMKDVGKFPNVSALAYSNNKLYITSRTKSRLAIIDYDTLGLIKEFTTVNKPTSMLINKNILFVLGSQNNQIQMVDTLSDNIIGNINLNTGGYSARLNRIQNTNCAIVTDLKNHYYSIIDLEKKKLIKTYEINIPLKDVIIADKVKLFD